MLGDKKGGVGIRVYADDGNGLVKRKFQDIAESGKRMFAEIALGAQSANPAIVAVSRGSQELQGGVQGLADRAGVAGRVLGAFGAAGIGAAAALGVLALGVNQARAGMDFADELADTAAQLNVTTDALQEWRYVLRMSGGEAVDAERALEKFRVTYGRAKADLGRAADKPFDALGLGDADLERFGSVEEALDEVIVRIANLSDEAEQAAVAEKLGLTELLPVIRQGAQEIARLREEAHRLGLVMDSELIRRAAETKDQFETVSEVVDIQLKQAFVDLGPVLVWLMGLLGQLATEISRVADLWRDLENRSMRGLKSEIEGLKGERATILRLARTEEEMDRPMLSEPGWASRLLGSRGARLSAMTGVGRGAAISPNERIAQIDARIAEIEAVVADRDRPPPPSGSTRLINQGGAARSSSRSGPTPEEQAAQFRAIQLEQQLYLARQRGDTATEEMVEAEQFLAAQRERYIRAGRPAAEAERLAQEDADLRQLARDAAARRKLFEAEFKDPVRPGDFDFRTQPVIPDLIWGPDGKAWSPEQKDAWARSVGDATAEGLDAAIRGDWDEWVRQKIYNAALDGFSNAITKALNDADFSFMGGDGGNWFTGLMKAFGFGGGQDAGAGTSAFLSGVSGARAAGGPTLPGVAYMAGEHNRPEIGMFGAGYVADHAATQRMLNDAVQQAFSGDASGARGPSTVNVNLQSEVKIPPGHVSDRQLVTLVRAAHDGAVQTALSQAGAASSAQQAEHRFLKG